MSAHRFDPTILREYDIRGVVGKTLSAADARAIGQAFATAVIEAKGNTGDNPGGDPRRIAVGFDGRLSSPDLARATTEGILAAGANALAIGLGPTPMLYFATATLGLDGGIMITGSHNPPDYNGFKMMQGRKSFYGADIQRIGKIAASDAFAHGKGRTEKCRIEPAYIDALAAAYDGKRALRVAWDAGNGASGHVMAALTRRLAGTHFLLYEEIDGTFPNHHPDPTVPKNLAALRQKVREERCDLGIAFDGDGDRIGVVDGDGNVLWGDQLLAILARDVLASNPGATVIADVKASQVLFDEIARLGGKPLMWRTGHSLIKSKMAETGAPLAGEMSGHIFFADKYYGFDDALYAAVRMLNVVSRSIESLGRLRAALPQVMNTPELRFPCTEDRKFRVIDEVRDRLRAAGADFSDIDGVRVKTPDGWWLLRASNTQDVLVARCEAGDRAGLQRLRAALAEQLRPSGIAPPED